MASPILSDYFENRKPSPIRAAQLRFLDRNDGTEDVNVAIGNVSLPMHPAMTARMKAIGEPGSPFADGIVRYTLTAGAPETQETFRHVIASSGCDADGLHVLITDGGSMAMEIAELGTCGPHGSSQGPVLLIDASYTNYHAFAARMGRTTVSVTRMLGEDGKFSLPSMDEIEKTIREHQPSALVVIPFDNPTGQFYEQESIEQLARLCVKHNMWMISDEAYRELQYTGGKTSSVWALTEKDVPGITGRRISIETSSKVWNACGLRVGALVTDNEAFYRKSVAEYTANLCAPAIAQWIFAAIGQESHADLQKWYDRQRAYYKDMLVSFTNDLRGRLPGVIVSSPDAALYSVIDVRNLVEDDFDAMDFVLHSAGEGAVDVDGKKKTLLVAPLAGFYKMPPGKPNPGRTQMRVAYVEPPESMAIVPKLFAELWQQYTAKVV